MTDTTRQHWNQAYQARQPDRQSWFQTHPEYSLAMIHASGIGPDEPIIDVGGGASLLVDFLLDRGFGQVTVLDVSATALETARRRLGERAGQVGWLCADIRNFEPQTTYRLWHDRALFHFLVDEADRGRYRRVLEQAVAPGGHVIIGAFAMGGPLRCSGLDIVQYDEHRLLEVLGPEFSMQQQATEMHTTPSGVTQSFAWFRLRRR